MKKIIRQGIYIVLACLVVTLSMHFTFTTACCSESNFKNKIANSENCCIIANEVSCCSADENCCSESGISSCDKKITNVHFDFETITTSFNELQPKFFYLLKNKIISNNFLIYKEYFLAKSITSKYLPNYPNITEIQVFLI
tara:strand:+ start:5154 stop:5576 length:423 start_codon:yes stop_codon:yes gene_type:complete